MTSTPERSHQQAVSGPLDAYLRLSPDAVLAVDAHGQIRAANALAGELFGYGLPELTGLTVEQLMPGRFQTAHAAHREAYGRSPRQRRMGTGWTCGPGARTAASSRSTSAWRRCRMQAAAWWWPRSAT
jgi:PAS domain-containing protein